MRSASVRLVVLVGVVVSACGTAVGDSTTSTLGTTSTSTIVAPATTTTTAAPSTTTTQPPTTPTTTSPPAATTSTLGGRPNDLGPAAGHRLMVVGVAHDDVLNLRAGPGVGEEILGRIPPTHDDLVALGHTRELPASLWIEVEYEGDRGWVNLSYIAYAGPVVDMTADVVADLGGYPTNPSLRGLAEEIAAVFALDEDPVSRVVQVTPVGGGSLGEVTYDVIGLADDSVRGLRLHIFAEEDADGFGLKSVEARLLCGRGVESESCV